jgi:hypothetical protein
MERGNTPETAGDMTGVFLNCNILNQNIACVAAHYFRDVHFVGGGIGSRNATTAAVWLSCLSPIACSTIWFDHVWVETDKAGSAPNWLIGSNGSEGVYQTETYPFNTWTNSSVNIGGGVTIENCYSDWTSISGPIRIRSANTGIGRGLQISGTRFDSAQTPAVVVIEPDAPSSVIVRYGDGNSPQNLVTRTRDNRPSFLASTVEANLPNLINSGWRNMEKGGTHFIGATIPITTATNLTGPFGVDLAGGSVKETALPLWSGTSRFSVNSNTVLYLDYAVHWPGSAFGGSAVRMSSTETGLTYQNQTLGPIGEYARYTNQWGVWKRYIAAIRAPAGVNLDQIMFNNYDDTNTTVVLGYLAIYSPTFSGDGSGNVPAGAAVWAGKMDAGDIQWSVTASPQNGFARKWTSGWAVRGAFSSGTEYSRGTSVSAGTNIYLATAIIPSGGAAPSHGSGIVDGWSFVATGPASVERRVVTETAAGVMTTTRVVATTATFGGGTGDASAALDVASTTRGFLPPRLTEAQRDLIPSPRPGLMIFNITADKLQVRSSVSWVDLH